MTMDIKLDSDGKTCKSGPITSAAESFITKNKSVQDNGKILHVLLIDSKPLEQGKKLFQFLSTICVGFVGMQGGITLGWTSQISLYLQSRESFTRGLNDNEKSWLTSLLAMGAMLGAIPSGKIADLIGRKSGIILAACPFLISWLILIFVENTKGIYVGRFIGGIGAGSSCVLIPLYVAEIAEPSIRGSLGVFYPLLFSFGLVYSYIFGAYTSYRVFNISCCLILLPFLMFMFFLPESPLWLIQKGRRLEANRVLTIIRGGKYDKQREITMLQEEADKAENKRGGILDLIGTKTGRKAIAASLGLMWFQEMSGVDAVLSYTQEIFVDANSSIKPEIATIVIGCNEVIMTIVVAIIIDKFGRKPLLILSGTLMTICLAVMGYYFHLQSNNVVLTQYGWIPLVTLSFFNVVFSIGFGAVPFAVISELFPPETKGVASSICVVVHWGLVFTVTKFFPTLEYYLGKAVTFWIFGCFTAISAVFTFFFVPETKGKTLQDIQKKLERNKDVSILTNEPSPTTIRG